MLGSGINDTVLTIRVRSNVLFCTVSSPSLQGSSSVNSSTIQACIYPSNLTASALRTINFVANTANGDTLSSGHFVVYGVKW